MKPEILYLFLLVSIIALCSVNDPLCHIKEAF